MAKSRIVYWIDEKTGGYVELAGTEWDGDLSDEELLAKAQRVAEEEAMDLSYGKIILEIVEEEEDGPTLSAAIAELDRLSYGGKALSPQYPDMWAAVAGSAEIQLGGGELIVAIDLGEIRESIRRAEPEAPTEVGYRLEQPGAYPQRITWGWVATGEPAPGVSAKVALAARSYHYCGYDTTEALRASGYSYTGPRCDSAVYADRPVTHIELRPDVEVVSNDADGASATWDLQKGCPFVKGKEATKK